MKKTLSLEDHILIGHFLKVAHHAILKADNILANKHGKSKGPHVRLTRLKEELLQLRCDIEDAAYHDLSPKRESMKLRQRYLGPIDEEIFGTGDDLYIK